MKKICLVIFISCLAGAAFSQNTRSTQAPKPPRPQYQAAKKEKKSFFQFLQKKKTDPHRSTNAEEVAAFRQRMKKVSKKKAKEEKLSKKPQYSDPSYLGHKRPPKKRPVGKQKFCKVCQMKH